MITAAERLLEEEPAPQKELFQQSRSILQQSTEPGWEKFFAVLRGFMERIISRELPPQYDFRRFFLRSWVLQIDEASDFMRTGSTLNVLHSHIPAVLSSVFYLQVPDDLINAPSGGTTFRDPNSVNTRAYSRPDFHVSPAPLRLVIFPAFLEHCPEQPRPEVVMEKPRIIVATDLRVDLY